MELDLCFHTDGSNKGMFSEVVRFFKGFGFFYDEGNVDQRLLTVGQSEAICWKVTGEYW